MGQLKVTSDVVAPPLDCVISNPDWQNFVSLISVEQDDALTFFNFGSQTPSPADRVKPWVRTDATGLDTGIWVYASGYWTQKHQIPTGITCIWTGAEADIDTLDGGEAGAISALTGPFWAKVASFNAKMPLGCGTLPSTLVINPLDTAGEETHKLLTTEVPAHAHLLLNTDIGASVTSPTSSNFITKAAADPTTTPNSYNLNGSTTAPTIALSETKFGDGSGNTVSHNNLPPYVGCFFIARTARTHRRVAG